MSRSETPLRRYRAFVSYSHADRAWGYWVRKALENYRPPRGVGDRPGRIRPIFRDDDETSASADLGAVITEALDASEALIVVCSPNSARSRWVDKEIHDFKALGRGNRIFALIVGGVPHDAEQGCFPPSVSRGTAPRGTQDEAHLEPLAIDVRVHGRRDALLKIAAGLLEVPYDALKRRDRIRSILRLTAVVVGILAVLLAYTASLFVQTRAVNSQISSLLSAAARKATDDADHGRALRLAVIGARSSLISPQVPEVEPILSRAAHYTTLDSVLDGHHFPVYSADWDATGSRLVTGSQDQTIRLWRADKWGHWAPDGLPLDTGWAVMDARFAEGGKAVAVRPLSLGGITLWRVENGAWRGPVPLGAPALGLRAFDMNSDGDVAVIGLQEGSLQVWAFSDERWVLESELSTDEQIAETVALTNDGCTTAAGLLDGTIRIWQREPDKEWRPSALFPEVQPGIQKLEFSTSGDRLLSAGIGSVQIFRRALDGDWHRSGRISGDPQMTAAAFMPPDGSFVVTNAGDASATLWPAAADESWVEVCNLGTGIEFSRTVAFDPSGFRLVTAGNDAAVRIWLPGEIGSWQSYAKVVRGIGRIRDVDSWTQGHTGFEEPNTVSPDGRRRAVGDVYGIVRVADVETSLEVAAYDASDTPRFSLEWVDGGAALQVRKPDTGVVTKTLSTHFSAELSGDALIRAVCDEKLRGPMRILSGGDIAAAPILRGHEGEDVCRPPSLWRRSWQSIRLLFSPSG